SSAPVRKIAAMLSTHFGTLYTTGTKTLTTGYFATICNMTECYSWSGDMATVRKREWASGGKTKTAWVADYSDGRGRHIETFDTKGEAEKRLRAIMGEVDAGTHTADSNSKTIAVAGEGWIAEAEDDELERSTVEQYKQHLELHIRP